MAQRALSELLEAAFLRCRDLQVPLAERLQAFADEVRPTDPRFSAAVDSFIARLSESGAGTAAPKVGEPLPPFLLPDESGRLVRLEDLLGAGPVAIAFHFGHWCPYCRINIDALARAAAQIAPEGRNIAAIVPERRKFTAWMKAEANAPFPVLSDMGSGYAMSLGLAIWVGEEMKSMIVQSGWDPAVSQGTENWLLPIPATFIVGTDGIISARFLDPDYRKRMAIEDLVAALRAAG
jgi:peroxiredoxin